MRTPLRFRDRTMIVTGCAVEVVEVVVVVVVVDEVLVDDAVVVEVVDVEEVVEVVEVVLVVDVVEVEVERVNERFVLPCKVSVSTPPPPFALVLANVPVLAPVT